MQLRIGHLTAMEKFELTQCLLGKLTKTGHFRPSFKVNDVMFLQVNDAIKDMHHGELMLLAAQVFESGASELILETDEASLPSR
jgi:hypothetical protein